MKTKASFNYSYFIFVVTAFIISACNKQDAITIKKNMILENNWTFTEAGKNELLPAIVPGTVHTDLINNKIIPDPHYRTNEDDIQWIEDKDWEYNTSFKGFDAENIELIFHGLDTYAEIYLNEKLILESDNMFIAYKADIKNLLNPIQNDLKIIFRSPIKMGMKKLQKLNYIIPAINEQAAEDERTNVFTRKAPFHYGWDWGPRLVSSGIWRPIELVGWNNARLKDVNIHTNSINDKVALLLLEAEIETSKKGKYKLSLNINGKEYYAEKSFKLKPGEKKISLDFEIEDPKLWWSNGLGEAYLYDFNIELSHKGKVIDQYHLEYGVRSLKLVQDADEKGRSFYFELNGVPVFMKGANIIPPETLTPSTTDEAFHKLIDNAVNANMNMLRVWGGAIYQEELFYKLCDKNGILVWQDFMFSCALQPGDEEHLDNIRKEAEYNVKRLRNYACLALWCGNNENLHGWHEWGWNNMYEPEVKDFMWKTFERIWYEILPEAVKKFDPKTPYWSSSPMAFGNQKADRKSGDEHDWTIWFGQLPFSNYANNVPRFVSEYGLQSFPDMHTINKFTEEEDRKFSSTVMRHRQRGRMEYISPGFDGNDMIKKYMQWYYKVPEKFEDFTYVSQLLQAKAYKTAIEAHRRNMPHCMGSLYWQLNDSWPTISWSTVDYFGQWKAAHYAVKKANKEIIVSTELENNNFNVYAVNDGLTVIKDVKLLVKLVNFYGLELYNAAKTIQIPPNTSTLIFKTELNKMLQQINPKSSLVTIELKKDNKILANNLFYFNPPKDLMLPKTNIDWHYKKTNKGYKISLLSEILAKNVYLNSHYDNIFFSDNYFDLLPGQIKTVEIYTDYDIDINNDLIIKTLNNCY